MPGVSPPAEPPLSPPLSPPAPQEDFAGAPVYLPDGSAPAAPVICFAKAVREPRRGCDTIVTTSHGPPGAAATTITHRRPEPSQLSQLSQQQLPSLCALLPPADEPGGGASSTLEELLSLPELRDAVLQWLPCCDLFRARRISRRLLVWADAALAAQRSPAVVGNATRDYYGLELTQQLDPRGLAFATLGPPVPAVRGHRPADDCTQIGSRIFALRGSSLAVAELPELPEPGGTEDSSPASPVLEPVSSPEREPRDSGSQRESTPHKGGVGSLPIGTPTSTRADRSPELVWRDGIFQIPAPGAGLRRSRAPSLDHLRVGGRLCAMRDGGLLLVGGGVDQTVAPPPADDLPPLDPLPPAADDLDEMLDIGRARAARERAAAARADLAAAAVLRQELQRRTTALGITAQVLRVHPSTGLWQRLPDLLEARRDCIVAALPDGGVLVAGGSDARGAIASAERYDPIVSRFRLLSDLSRSALPCETALAVDTAADRYDKVIIVRAAFCRVCPSICTDTVGTEFRARGLLHMAGAEMEGAATNVARADLCQRSRPP